MICFLLKNKIPPAFQLCLNLLNWVGWIMSMKNSSRKTYNAWKKLKTSRIVRTQNQLDSLSQFLFGFLCFCYTSFKWSTSTHVSWMDSTTPFPDINSSFAFARMLSWTYGQQPMHAVHCAQGGRSMGTNPLECRGCTGQLLPVKHLRNPHLRKAGYAGALRLQLVIQYPPTKCYSLKVRRPPWVNVATWGICWTKVCSLWFGQWSNFRPTRLATIVVCSNLSVHVCASAE